MKARHPFPWRWDDTPEARTLTDATGEILAIIPRGAGTELRRRVRDIVAGSGRPAQRLPRRVCKEGAARAKWRAIVTEALTSLRECRPRGPVLHPAATELSRSLIAEILRVRLIDCHKPIATTTDRIAWQFAELFGSYRDQWKPPAQPPAPLPEIEPPTFLLSQTTGE